uniref:Ig-like domain-containing protein n=1 Tax=Electrophorus electricus TaxID=8005 RepID=A0A4W4E5T9_ELEEL
MPIFFNLSDSSFCGDQHMEMLTCASSVVPLSTPLALSHTLSHMELETELVEFNSTASLTCSASGTSISFFWLNGSSELTLGERVQLTNGNTTLIITCVSRDDIGPYRCGAFNIISKDMSQNMTLTIYYGPDKATVAAAPVGPFYSSGCDIMLRCSAEASPAAVFQWVVSGTVLGEKGPELKLANIQTNQSGSYTCLAHNTKSLRYSTSQPINIIVVEKISQVTLNDSTGLLIEGRSFSNLTCEGSGTILSTEWMKDYQILSPSNSVIFSPDNKTVLIGPVRRSDSGEYQCTLSNPVSSDTAKFIMTVNYGPDKVVIGGPSEVEVQAKALTFECITESIPTASYTWEFNGTNTGVTTVSFIVELVHFENSGKYTCIAQNHVTKLNASGSHALVVKDPISVMPSTDQPLLNQTPKVGRSFHLTCNGASPPVTIIWFKDGGALTLDNRMSLSFDNATLSFSALEKRNGGQYECRVINGSVSVISGDYWINFGYVIVTPTGPNQVELGVESQFICDAKCGVDCTVQWALHAGFPKGRGNKDPLDSPITNVSLAVSQTNLVEFNDSVTFTCSAHGTPLEFSWRNRSSELTSGGSVQLSSDGRILTITNLTRYDQGPFTCIVANGISNGTSGTIYLKISYGPSNLTMIVIPKKTGYISGSNITLTCSADSSPPALFLWSNNNVFLNTSGQSLQLTNASQNQTGSYTLTNETSIHLNQPIFNMSFTLSCDIIGPVDSTYWEKNGLYLHSDSRIFLSNQNKTLTLTQLTLPDDGDYQCVASNSVSNMTSGSYRLMVNYGPWNTSVSGPAIAAVLSSVSLNCCASSQPPSEYTWYFNGSKVAEGTTYMTGALSLNNSGEYTCITYNNITSRSGKATWNLSVIGGIKCLV